MKFVKRGAGSVNQPLFGLRRLLDWVFIFLAVGWPTFVLFEGDILLGEVNADKATQIELLTAALLIRLSSPISQTD